MSEATGFQIPPPLSSGVGYGIIVGVGAAFAIGMSAISWALSRYMNEIQDSEMFMTAKHSVKTGLTASAVVSSWTIAATLLTSTTYGYDYGVSGPYWYAAGACVQIMLFSVAAIELKRRAPKAQTFLQLVRVRYGTATHLLFSSYSLVYQLLTTVSLLVGGSSVFSAMTGVNRDASCFLFPIGVVIYTLAGGIKATFITDWIHTVIIYVIMLMSLFIVYTTSDVIGSSDRMWDLLKEASVLHPVDGNAGGEYLTMRSQDGAYIGLVLIGAGFAASVDSQLFQKAIAADPRSTSMGYILGGLSWFTIPFVLASTFGIVAAGAEHLPQFPTYPNRMTADEVAAGMAMPYAAMTVMGTGGVVAVLLMIFMAVTSAMSSETVATTALLAYNLYKAYINPNATSNDIMRFSHWATPGFAVVAAAVAVGFNHVSGFSVGFLIVCVGIVVDSMIVPMACTIMWKKQSKLAAILSPVLGSCLGLLAWFVKTKTEQGVINITTLNAPLPLAAGNMVSLCSPIILTPLITYIKPASFDWNIFHTEIKRDDEEAYEARGEEPQLDAAHDAENQVLLLKARNRAIFISVFLTLAFCLLWPIPMYGTGYIFSRGFFKGWVVVLFFWGFFAAGVITLLPIWEGKDFIVLMYRYFRGTYVPPTKHEVVEGKDTAESSEKGVTIDNSVGHKSESGS